MAPAARSFDNITVDADGNVIVQEDPGNSSYIAKTWKIDPATKAAVQIFESDRERFLPAGRGFLTQDEENSGVIEVTGHREERQLVRGGSPLLPRQHAGALRDPGELVEGGQLYLMASPKVASPKRQGKQR